MKHRPGYENSLSCIFALFAFFLPISIVLVQPVAYIGVIISLLAWWHSSQDDRPPYPFGSILLVFLLVVVAVSIFGIRPETSLKKINRFTLLLLAWGMTWLVWQRRNDAFFKLDRLAACFLIGLGLRAALDLVRVPILVSMDVPLFHTGNMRDPQFYMVGLCLATGMIISKRWSTAYPPTVAAALFSAAGLIIHFKRGAWAATLGALAVMALASKKWRPIGVAGLVVITLLLVPTVRERIHQLGREFDPQGGGRMLLWTEVGPEMIREHPWGAGWKAIKHEDLVAVSDRVEPKLNHLHNNQLQITLELGWAGHVVWLVWMGAVLVIFWRAQKNPAFQHTQSHGIALGGLGAFSGLLLNGLVEYNFGDSEVFMLMVWLMGLAASVYALQRGPSQSVFRS